jgi:hypothetical protein
MEILFLVKLAAVLYGYWLAFAYIRHAWLVGAPRS